MKRFQLPPPLLVRPGGGAYEIRIFCFQSPPGAYWVLISIATKNLQLAVTFTVDCKFHQPLQSTLTKIQLTVTRGGRTGRWGVNENFTPVLNLINIAVMLLFLLSCTSSNNIFNIM